ncbi:hypothetical protein P910_001358 [Xylella fastidiosa Mul-MD]|nr:hypothetical protein P303_07765 [Xylella fastidiosa MUL0034]EWG15059.1 hypothetical protein P910_001358 [Xylella fastidiosa Mul-MD]
MVLPRAAQVSQVREHVGSTVISQSWHLLMGRVHLSTASDLGVVFVDFVDVQTDHSAEDGEDLWLFI